MQRSWLNAASAWASVGAELLSNPALPMGYLGLGPATASALQVFANAAATHDKPVFGIETVEVGGKPHAVTETVELPKPFGALRHFKREGLPADAPKVLIVAPMSGHYATLLRGTVARMIENQEVWITDWADAKLVPVEVGTFDLDDYIDYLIEFLEFIGPGTHVIAVCQPSVPAFAATAVMGADKNPWSAHALYESQSPVHQVQNIKTPFLILHGTDDGAVDWLQGVELYNAARRFGKNVILLSYPGENHHLAKKENTKDFQVRMKQYFDHYLKGAPAPSWMTDGVPHLKKGTVSP